MGLFNLLRLLIFSLIVCFSLVVLVILCNLTNITTEAGFYYSSFALGIAAALMSILIIVSGLVIERFRRGAITSLVWFELAWTALVWVLWLAAAAAMTSLGIFTSCGFTNASVESNCQQYQAALGLSWILWVLTFGWFCWLLIFSVVVAAKDERVNVWQTAVNEHPLFYDRRVSNASDARGGHEAVGQKEGYGVAVRPLSYSSGSRRGSAF